MANYQITNKLEDSIQSSVNYKITDGLQKLEDYVSNLSIDQKRRFFKWLIGKYDIEKQDYQTLDTNHELYKTINYFIQNNSFNKQTVYEWLSKVKRSAQNNYTTDIEKKKILAQTEISLDNEKEAKLKAARRKWENIFLEYTDDGDFVYYNPEDERASIHNLISFHKAYKKNSVEFKMPAPPDVEYYEESLPEQQFTSIVFPVLQAQHMLKWIDKEINHLQKPKPILDPNIKLKDIFKSIAEYQYIMQIMIDEKMVHSITHRWIDKKSAPRKGITCFIKKLDVLGYLNNKPNRLQIKLIVKNTFGLDISISTIGRTSESSVFLPQIRPSSI